MTISLKSLVTLVALFSLCMACGTSSRYAVRSPRYQNMGDDKAKAKADAPEAQRIVIYNATLRIVVWNPDSLNRALTDLSKRYSGYTVSLGNHQSTIRVEAGQLKHALTDLATYGKVKDKVISGEDVTEEYHDFQIRFDNATKARERYLELLARAENVEAALKIEKELERLTGEIDVMKGKLERMKHMSDYSTITINIEQKVQPGILGYVGIGVYKAVKWLFVWS